MKAQNNERTLDLYPEKPGYPWQILEAEGETWVIVRWRKKIALNPLRKIVDVSLKNLSGDIVYKNEEKCFYHGQLSLLLSYNEWEDNSPKIEDNDLRQELPHEEYWFSEGLFTEKKEVIPASFEENNYAQETEFFTLLLDGSELKTEQDSPASLSLGTKSSEIVLTWRCWLKGGGENVPAILKKVHVAQVGLYTLLLEAVIKLEKRKQECMHTEDKELTTTIAEEKVFVNPESSICEILGMPVEMAFWRYSYDKRRERLLLRVLKRMNLIYISSISGGERIIFAADRGEEEYISIDRCINSLYPAKFEIKREQVKTGLLGENKVLFQCKNIFHILEEPPQEKPEVIVEKKAPQIAVATPPKRNRPGEKWMKKCEKSAKGATKKVITIKF